MSIPNIAFIIACIVGVMFALGINPIPEGGTYQARGLW